MKKSLLFLLIFTLFILLPGCGGSKSIEASLKSTNIETDKIYYTDYFDKIIVAFFKDKESGSLSTGIFNKEKDHINFVIQQDIPSNLNSDEDLTAYAFLQSKTAKLPEFSFQFGVIGDSKIENVNLHMTDNTDFEDRLAKVIELDGLRVWYTFIDTKKIFNIQQGISSDGTVIYSNSKN